MVSQGFIHTFTSLTIGQCFRGGDALPSPKLGPRWALVSKTVELWGLEGMLPTLNIKRGRGAC